MNFIASKIKEGEGTVADKLRLAREKKSISLEEISKKLNIKIEYLEYLEKGEYEKLPSGAYEKIFLKKYASLLKIDFEELKQNLENEKAVVCPTKEKNIFSQKKINNREFLVFPKIIKNALIIIIVSGFLIYLGLCLKNGFSPPKIEITEPVDNLIIEENFVYVAGKTNPETEVSINGRQILKNDSGEFKEKIDLKKGLNTILISAQNKYSKKTEIKKQILVK